MEDDVRKQTFPSITASPGWFFGLLSIFTTIIFAAALYQRLVRLPFTLQQAVTQATGLLPQLYRLLQDRGVDGLPKAALRQGRRWYDPEAGARRTGRQNAQDPSSRGSRGVGTSIPMLPSRARISVSAQECP